MGRGRARGQYRACAATPEARRRRRRRTQTRRKRREAAREIQSAKHLALLRQMRDSGGWSMGCQRSRGARCRRQRLQECVLRKHWPHHQGRQKCLQQSKTASHLVPPSLQTHIMTGTTNTDLLFSVHREHQAQLIRKWQRRRLADVHTDCIMRKENIDQVSTYRIIDWGLKGSAAEEAPIRHLGAGARSTACCRQRRGSRRFCVVRPQGSDHHGQRDQRFSAMTCAAFEFGDFFTTWRACSMPLISARLRWIDGHTSMDFRFHFKKL